MRLFRTGKKEVILNLSGCIYPPWIKTYVLWNYSVTGWTIKSTDERVLDYDEVLMKLLKLLS